jgi:hypothetical protein
MDDDDSLKARRDQASDHPLREKILALTEGREGPIDPEWLRWVLPDSPSLKVVEYHLSVLRENELLE